MFEYLIKLYSTEQKNYAINKTEEELLIKEYLQVKLEALPNNPNAQVNFFMALVIKITARNPKPTPENPIMIRNCSPEAAKYIWTSLMILGATLPDNRFDHKSIKCWVKGFNEKEEMGYISTFSWSSLYENKFKYHLSETAITNYLVCPPQQFVIPFPIKTTLISDTNKTLPSNAIDSEIAQQKITATVLCQLAKAGRLADIKKYTVSAEEIDALVHHAIWGNFASTAGAYNALMVATAYRHFDIIQYFIEEKKANCAIKGGRNGGDYPA